MSELSCDTPFIGQNETHDLSRSRVEIDAVVVRVPSHVVPVHKGCHRQWRRHLIKNLLDS